MSETTEIKKLVEATHHVPVVMDCADGRKFVALPVGNGGFALQDISLPHTANVAMPKVVHQQIAVQTSGSLIEYAERFKNADSMLFADIDANRIVCAIDYHTKSNDEGETGARLGVHTATLSMPFSKEWQTWTGGNEKLMGHETFASFLEENAIDVIVPDGAELLELCRDLQVKSGSQFRSSVRMGDTVSIEYQKDSDVSTRDNIALPVIFTLMIPVYFGEPMVEVKCFTRRKIDDGALHLGYKMVRAENIRQADFQRVASRVQFDTGLTLVYGKR